MSWQQAQTTLISGNRLHLHHGPIDLIIKAWGSSIETANAYQAAEENFSDLLETLVTDLPNLRQQVCPNRPLAGPVTQRMHKATSAFSDQFITPMAAVAGAVADHMINVLAKAADLEKALVNNGGDIALYLAPKHDLTIGCETGQIQVQAEDPIRGIATSGWRGRSHSLGIADSVTVLATNAAQADAAATMIANQVDLPQHPAIHRAQANTLASDSDLGQHWITTGVDPLTEQDIKAALQSGAAYANALWQTKTIIAAQLSLQGHHSYAGSPDLYLADKTPKRSEVRR